MKTEIEIEKRKRLLNYITKGGPEHPEKNLNEFKPSQVISKETKDTNIIKIMPEINKIYNLDCIEGMSKMPDNSVHLTITSPPYNINSNKYTTYKDNMEEEEYYNFIKLVITELIRITKYYSFLNFQLLSNNKRTYLQIMSDFKDNIKDIIIWSKDNAQPSPYGCLTSTFEFILILTKKEFAVKKKFERCNFQHKYLTNMIKGPNASSDKIKNINHKAVFPRYIPRWFIKNFAQENDIIFDPFAGSNTTGKVAKELGFNFLGFEINPDYIKSSNYRTSQESLKIISQSKLV